MAYTIISQNNNTTTLSDGVNTITVPSRVNLTSGNFTIVEVNNNMATLEDGDGNVYRDIPCVATLAGEGGGGGTVDYSKTVQKTNTMPTADATNAGQVYMYTGATDANYTTNYIYKNVATSTYDSTVTFEPATLSSSTIACSGSDFATFVAEWGSGDITTITHGTLTYDQSGGLLVFVGKDSSESTVCTFQLYTEDYQDSGFTITGTLQDGDVFAFATTITESSTYAWTQTDVQPAGATGINWATSVDLPANSGLGSYAFPIYTIQGGLPDGEYEFYWQIACMGSSSDAPFGQVTYNCRFKITDNNGTKYCYGMFAPVIDGNWLPGASYIPNNQSFYNFMYVTSNNDYIIYANTLPWVTDIAANDDSLACPDCFKISAIKNLGTGVEYIPTGELYNNVTPTFDHEIGTQISSQRLSPDVYVPQYHVNTILNYDDNNQYIVVAPGHSIANGIGTAVCSELDFSMETDNGAYRVVVENAYDTYVARVLEASGDLENAQIGWSNTGDTYVYLNTTAGTSGSVKVAFGVKGSGDGAAVWMSTPDTFTPAEILKIGATVTPQNYGEILQYTGETDANYTNGYFYKATGTAVTTPADITISNMSPNDLTLNISDVDSFVSALATTFGWELNYVKQQFANGTSLSGYWDSDNDVITVINIGFMGDVTDQTVLSYVSMSTTGTYTGEINFYSDAVYVPAHTEIQNGSWVRVDVQPGTKVNSTVTIAVADWNGGTTVTKTVAGITATGVVLVSPDPTDQADYTSAGILCTAQAADSLTFTCSTTPSADIDVNVVML